MDYHLVLLAIDILNSNEHLGRSDWRLYQDQIESYGSNRAFDRVYKRTFQEALCIAAGYQPSFTTPTVAKILSVCGQSALITPNGMLITPSGMVVDLSNLNQRIFPTKYCKKIFCSATKGHKSQHWTTIEGERVNWE